MNWTPERVDQLKNLWGEGHSASQIARAMGSVTRNAVIGKAHRLKLAGRTKNARIDDQNRAAHQSRRVLSVTPVPLPDPGDLPSAPAEIPASAGTPYMVSTQKPLHIVHDSAPEDTGLKTDHHQGKTILELTERMCRWPIGEPGSQDFHFCGKCTSAGIPYCDAHAGEAYQPMHERRRERRSSGS